MSVTTAKPPLHPTHDRTFPDRLVNDLIQHYGEWRKLASLYAWHVEIPDRYLLTREVIEGARRIGMVIEGDKQLGYRLTGFRRRPYVHAAKEMDWPAVREMDEPVDGQLTLGVDEAWH